MIQEIAAEHGLEVQAELYSSHPIQPAIAQFEQSDLAFILGSARRAGLDIWLSGNRLAMRDRRSAGDEIELAYGQGLLSFQARADLADQLKSLSVTGWDVQNKQVVEASAGDSAIQDELDSRHSGSQYLESSAARHERLPASLAADAQQAKALAEAAFWQRARRFVSGIALVQGNPHLRLGGRVHLQGLGPLFSGAYFIEKVRHLYDHQSGYRTELLVSRPGLEQQPRSRYPSRKPKGQVRKRSSKASPPSGKPGGRKLEP
jgi:phage protein D